MLALEQIRQLYDKYREIVKWEIVELGCKPTEMTHLIGRLGEFYCALHVGGELSHQVNQHGFDVTSPDGRNISVKTTAQTTGFVSINKSTLEKVDDLMFLHFVDNDLLILYYGPIQDAVKGCREWNGKFELDIVKAKKIIKPMSNGTEYRLPSELSNDC